MQENRKNVFLFGLFNIAMICLIIGICYVFYGFITKSNKFGGIPIYGCIKITNKICLTKDLGYRSDYNGASMLCSRGGRSLPSLEDAWNIWISSENCNRIFSSNEIVPKDKQAFLKGKLLENDTIQAKDITNYCKKSSSIKFPIASQYKGGNYWLRDSAGANKHYVINFNTGKVSIQSDNIKEFGVRCVQIRD